MDIQKKIGHYLVFCSFFLFFSCNSFSETIELEQEKVRQESRCSRLSKYGFSVLTGLLVGSVGGYLCGQFDNQIGYWGIVCTWPLFASLRDFTLLCAEHEMSLFIESKDKERSCLKLMKIVARLAEWGSWLMVTSDKSEVYVSLLPVLIVKSS